MTALRPPALVFGVAIADLTMPETVEMIGALATEGRANGRTHQVCTVNVDFLVNALAEPAVAAILQRADLCIADGMPIVWGARLLGMPLRERVAGADLVPRLIEASQTSGQHVHVFGSAPDVADAARSLLRERYPDAHFSIDPGPMIPDVERVDDEVLESIAAVDADILCVALGNPKQERFIAAHRDRLRTPVMIGVGGSLDMLVGKRRRAPRWVQRIGLEWVARAVQEPRRLGQRYAHDIRVFAPAFAREWRRSRTARGGAELRAISTDSEVKVTLDRVDRSPSGRWPDAAAAVLEGAPLTISAPSKGPVSDRALAALVGLVQAAQRGGAPVIWRGPLEPIRDAVRHARLQPAMAHLPLREMKLTPGDENLRDLDPVATDTDDNPQ